MKKIEKLLKDIEGNILVKEVYLTRNNYGERLIRIKLYPDQSQKQPEEVEYEKRIRVLGELSGSKAKGTKCEYCGKDCEQIYHCDWGWVCEEHCFENPFKKPEKQEEWREELRKALDGKITIFEDLYRILKEKELTGWENEAIGNIIEIEIDCMPEEYSSLVKHISQLLSERTFTKEELALLKSVVLEKMYENREEEPTPIAKSIYNKLSKLLKEEG